MAEIVKVFGPPGTGKTSKLMQLVEAEVKQGTPLKRIGYVSFTKGAAEVIRERMHASEEDVKWFRTIHSACMSLLGIGYDSVLHSGDLRRFREETGLEVRGDEFDDWDEEKPLDYTPTKRAMELAAATQRDIYDVIREMPPHVNLTRGRVDLFVDAYTSFKRNIHKFDFTDMLTCYLEDGPSMPVDVLFLDEAQDLSLLQWLVFHRLARDAKRVYMAGDDDQAIYTFIGGSEYGFLDHEFNNEIMLQKSWRVPQAVGEAADQIIHKVGHRKDKAVEWRKDTGDVQRINLDAFTLPWRTYLDRYKTIMVLCRHRKGARNFSDDLKAVGIPHDINGEGMGSWREARIIHTYYTLREGGHVTVKQALKLLDELELSGAALKGLKPRTRIDAALLKSVDFKAPTWVQMFAGHDSLKIKRYEAIRQLVNNDGYGCLAKDPPIKVSTMHGAKGAEAELVIIVPECTGIVRRNILTPSEIRLAYVALTRTKKQAVVLIPRSDSYITHFFGG